MTQTIQAKVAADSDVWTDGACEGLLAQRPKVLTGGLDWTRPVAMVEIVAASRAADGGLLLTLAVPDVRADAVRVEVGYDDPARVGIGYFVEKDGARRTPDGSRLLDKVRLLSLGRAVG